VYHGPTRLAINPGEANTGDPAMAVTAGYDIGGAHLKVALTEDGHTIAVEQIACPLWQGLDRLEAAFAQVAPLTGRAERFAATMTGEMCELFPDRRNGVQSLVACLIPILGPETRIWMGPRGFGNAQQAHQHHACVASTNFLATATLVGKRLGDGLLIDMGSTTTDIIPVSASRPCPRGLTDGARLATSELVYTGLTRSDVATVARDVIFKGRAQRLAAGNFATMADVHRILGELPDDADHHETSDQRGKSLDESVARFARSLGHDSQDATLDDWRHAARDIADQQMRAIRDACSQVLTATPLPDDAPVIAAGIGAPLIETLASKLARPGRIFGDLANATDDCRLWATRCAPAVAVALLADTN
jgi:probable H4MPT-linked C1 transfer pathway protein